MTAIRICPIDWQESFFRPAHASTAAARREVTSNGSLVLTPDVAASTQHFSFCPQCRHAEAFAGTIAEKVFHVEQKAVIEARWNAEAERIFVEYTSGPQWSDEQRANHRARLWPERKTIEDWALTSEEKPFAHARDEADEAIDWPALIK